MKAVIEKLKEALALLEGDNAIVAGYKIPSPGIRTTFGGATMSTETVEPKRIDWSKMPRGTLVEYNGKAYFYCFSISETLALSSVKYADNRHYQTDCDAPSKAVKIIQGDWQVWTGGECPVPEGVMVSVLFRKSRSMDEVEKRYGTDLLWCWDGNRGDIIAYRIEGLADGWSV